MPEAGNAASMMAGLVSLPAAPPAAMSPATLAAGSKAKQLWILAAREETGAPNYVPAAAKAGWFDLALALSPTSRPRKHISLMFFFDSMREAR